MAEESSVELTENQMTALNKCFDSHDYEHSGFIDAEELGDVLREAGFAPDDQFIEDKKGGESTFTFEQVLDIVNEIKDDLSLENQQETLKHAFAVFDRDGNGFIEVEELRTTLQDYGQQMSEDDIQDLINRCDLDGDGKFHYGEFIHMIASNPGAIHVPNDPESDWP